MLIKYRTARYKTAIEAVECTRESAQCVWRCHKFGRGEAREIREAKVSDWSRLHDTWEAAHAYLMERSERALEHARLALQRAQGELGNVKGMKRPPDGNALTEHERAEGV